jgi:predicted O-methyltransferase YrrM
MAVQPLQSLNTTNGNSRSALINQLSERYLGRTVAHLTPRYVKNRLLVLLYERGHQEAPWLTADAISILSTLLRKTDDGLEYGSGRSTLWFAKRTRSLISIEDSPEWYARVTKSIQDQGINNVVYKFVRTERGLPDDPGRKTYVLADSEIAPGSFDYVLVDGYCRDECAMRAVEVLKPGGILIIDNANWFIPHPTHSPASATSADGLWREFLSTVENWRMIWTSNGVSDTAVWFKR